MNANPPEKEKNQRKGVSVPPGDVCLYINPIGSTWTDQILFEAKGEALLERIGMSKSEFARRMGIRKQNVKALFKTKNLKTIRKASEVLGLPFEMLIGYIEEPDLNEMPLEPFEEDTEVMDGTGGNLTFDSLVGRINLIQDALQAQAAHAVNLSLTARNWLVGYYIVEFEQHGQDRAKYGEKLLSRLSERLNQRGFNLRRLRDYRHVYQVYQSLGSVIVKFLESNRSWLASNKHLSIRLFSTAELQDTVNQHGIIRQSKTAKLEEWCTPPERLFYRLNYTILSYLATIDDPLKRAFYEQETIRGCWTQKELDRQVSAQFYERMGMLKDKTVFASLTMPDSKREGSRCLRRWLEDESKWADQFCGSNRKILPL